MPLDITPSQEIDWDQIAPRPGWVEPLAPWEAELLQAAAPIVGTANTITEGVSMPNEAAEYVRIEVPLTDDVKVVAFNNLKLGEVLSANIDPEFWEERRVAFTQSMSAGTVLIQRGGFNLNYPEATIGGRLTTVERVTPTTAAEMIVAASKGKLNLSEQEDSFGNTVRIVVAVMSLDNRAWIKYSGEHGVGTTNNGLSIYDLRAQVQDYVYYRDSGRRRAMIAAELEATRKQEKPVEKHNTAFTYSTERTQRFGAFLEKIKGQMVRGPQPLTLMPLLPKFTLSSRRWGIEIEAVDIAGIQTPEGWILHDDGSLRGMYSDGLNEHDEDCDSLNTPTCDCGDCTNDCTCGYDEQYDGETRTGEWNSPVLRSYHSRGLQYLCEQVGPRDSNTSPGIHVHVEAGDLTPDQAFRLSLIYSALEPLFEAEYHRDDREYCESVGLSELVERYNVLSSAKKESRKITDTYFDERYWTVNLMSLRQHGTVEFRAMGPVYDYNHLVRWAQFCREMVNIAAADVPQSAWATVRTFKDLLVVFSKYGKETPTPSWAKDVPAEGVGAIESLGSERRRLPNKVTHEDGITDVFEAYYGATRTVEPVMTW